LVLSVKKLSFAVLVKNTHNRKVEIMRLSNIFIAVAFSLCLLAPAAYADLSSTTYAKAKEEYVKGDCYKALPLLKKYKSEDDEFLNKNPTILSAIKDAIDYCQDILFPSLPGTSFLTGPPQQPDLPVNLAHAFDTKARLRNVIAELKSGKPNYDQMEPMLRITVRRQMAVLVPRLQALGSLLSISYEGQQQGADVYEVKFTNG
jgi:hypothetical protein